MTGSYAVAVGQRMRNIRQARGMTLRQIENASDGRFTAPLLGFWERGQKNMYAEDLTAYAAWLGIDLRLLLPPEPRATDALHAAAARIAAQAIQDVEALFASVTPERARALLIEALKESS